MLHREHLLPLQPVEILREAPSPGTKVMALHEQHDQGVGFIEPVDDVDEVPWMTLSDYGKEVAEGGLEEIA